MYFIGPWHVVEDPSRGEAILQFRLTADGRPSDVRDAPEGVTMLPPQLPFIRITARPWHNGGSRPYACDYFPAPQPSRPEDPVGTALLAVARDVQIDDRGFFTSLPGPTAGVRRVKQNPPHFVLEHMRVQTASLLPEPGEPLRLDSLLDRVYWSYAQAWLKEMEEARERGEDIRPMQQTWETMKRDKPPWLARRVTVQRTSHGVDITSDDGDYRVTIEGPGLDGRPLEPCAYTWELTTPIGDASWINVLRIVCTNNVRIRAAIYRNTRNPDEIAPVLIKCSRVNRVADVPPEGARLDGFHWTVLKPFEDHKNPDDRHYAEQERALFTLFSESPGLALMPMFLLGPGAAAVAGVLAVPLAFGGMLYSIDQRRQVALTGFNRFGQALTEQEAKDAAWWGVAGLVLDAAGALAATTAGVKLIAAGVHAAETSLVREIARSVPAALREAMRKVSDKALDKMCALLRKMRRADPAAARALGERIRQVLGIDEAILLDAELRQIFTDNFADFRITELRLEYSRYWYDKDKKVQKLSGAKAVAARAEIKSAIEWVTYSRNAAVRARMAQILGSDWVQRIQSGRRLLPVRRHLIEIYEFLRAAGPMPKHELIKYRDSIESVGRELPFEHTVENRFIEDLASRPEAQAAGINSAKELLDYEKAVGVFVALNSEVARQIPGYIGYTHTLKTRWMNIFIPHGMEKFYTLQDMCDATLFALAALGGRENGGLKVAMDTFRDLAAKLKQPLKVEVPTMERFAAGKWRYIIPDEEAALHIEAVQRRIEVHGFPTTGLEE